MSIKVIGTQATVHWLSNKHNSGKLTKDQGILYVTKDTKLGKATAESYAGLTPAEAFERRYGGMKSAMNSDFIATDFFVFDKHATCDSDPDDGLRSLIVDLNKKKRIPFSANVGSFQESNTNSEALIGYDRDSHLFVLVDVARQYFSLGNYYDTKDPIIWRFMQEEDVEEILKRLIQYHLCLYAAYTSRGKTKIGIEAAVRLCQQGGIVLVTTPITDTKKSFEENINGYHFGADRNLKVTYMDSVEFAKHTTKELRTRANNGELIFIVLTVQDLRYGEADTTAVDSTTKKLRDKYHSLSGLVNLWIRDERHAQYGGQVTSQRLADMKAEYELDLTATPYNVLDKYNWDQIVTRTLLWGLKYQAQTKLPTIRIDAISTPLSAVSPKIAALYSEEEGFDPRKLFVRNNGNFVLESELKDIRDKMYHSPLSKKKNPLSIVNDTELSVVAKNCGLWVLPEGQDGDGAADYIPSLAALLNTNSTTYFTDSYTLEKECPKNMTIGECIESLVKQHGRVVILTCGKFLTGTDIPCLGHIVLMAKMNNVANFEQLMGRMIREYPGKDEVKMYCFAPAMQIAFTQGLAAKLSSELGGGTEYEMLETVPLTEYTINGPKKLTPETILAPVYEFLKNNSKDALPTAHLETRLSGLDLSVWEGLNTKKFKKSAPKAGVTDDNGAKVKTKLDNNPKTGKPYTKDELNTITQIANAIQTVMVEAKWIAYTYNNYDYSVVLSNPVLAKMFPEEIDAVIDTVENDTVIKDMVIKNLNDKQLAYKGLAPMEVYDDIFLNNEYKRKIGLVYVNFAMAKDLVDNLPKSKYNKEGAVILVLNALSGTIPLLLKEKFPKARIVCAEYFEYFKDHLLRLGFEVTGVYEGDDGKLYLENEMKFDVVIGNPPYNWSDGDKQRKNNRENLWTRFVSKSFEDWVANNGYVAMVVPKTWMSPSRDYGSTIIVQDYFKPNQVEAINIDECARHFNVGSSFSYFVVKVDGSKSKNLTKVVSNAGEFDMDLSSPTWDMGIPTVLDKDIISMLGKFYKNATPFDWLRQYEGQVDEILDQGPVAVFHTPASKGKTFCNTPSYLHTTKKVMISLSGRYEPFYDDGNTSPSGFIVCLKIKQGETLANAQTVFDSKLYKLVVDKLFRYNGFINGNVLKGLPALDLTKTWTDQDIYKHFNLTQEEIDAINRYS